MRVRMCGSLLHSTTADRSGWRRATRRPWIQLNETQGDAAPKSLAEANRREADALADINRRNREFWGARRNDRSR
jgi:hypothetical protein